MLHTNTPPLCLQSALAVCASRLSLTYRKIWRQGGEKQTDPSELRCRKCQVCLHHSAPSPRTQVGRESGRRHRHASTTERKWKANFKRLHDIYVQLKECAGRGQRDPLRRLSCAPGMSISSCYHGSLPSAERRRCMCEYAHMQANTQRMTDWKREAVICGNLGIDGGPHKHKHTRTRLFWVSALSSIVS